jgi:hypothetical protein
VSGDHEDDLEEDEADHEAADFAELFHELSGDLDGVTTTDVDGGTEYRRADQPFASALAGVAEFRLDPEVAEAARRAPASSASRRGPSWVCFAPPALDRFAFDRAEAWFLSAWRAAARPDRRR